MSALQQPGSGPERFAVDVLCIGRRLMHNFRGDSQIPLKRRLLLAPRAGNAGQNGAWRISMVPTDIYATRVTSRTRRDLAGLFVQSIQPAAKSRAVLKAELDAELLIASRRMIARTEANWRDLAANGLEMNRARP